MGVVFLGKTDQTVDGDRLARIGLDDASVAAEHLVHLAGDDQQVGAGDALDEGGEHQIQPAGGGEEGEEAVISCWVVMTILSAELSGRGWPKMALV